MRPVYALLVALLVLQSVPPAPRPPALPPGPPNPELGSAAPDGYQPSPQWPTQTRAPQPASRSAFDVETFAEGLSGAFCFHFLPDGRILVGERPGRIKIVGKDGKVSEPLEGMPPNLWARGQGLFEVLPDRAFAKNRTIYLSYTVLPDGADPKALPRSPGVLLVARATLSADDRRLEQLKVLLDAEGTGGRVIQARDGTLFVTSTIPAGVGINSTDWPQPQFLDSLMGKVLRIAPDGSIPPDNPFMHPTVAPTRREIYAFGFRDIQGVAIEPRTGRLWTSEHGPRGGDEINAVAAAQNYGFPEVGYGREYTGKPIHGDRTAMPGTQQPVYFWTPDIAPAGIAFYDGRRFPEWRGNLFVSALAGKALIRLVLKDDRVVNEERLLTDLNARIRGVAQGPDDALYVLTDGNAGKILRLSPRTAPRSDIDADLTEVTVARLHALYAAHQYTVTQVTQWYLSRIKRYDATYKAFLHVDEAGALATAAGEDKAGARPNSAALWGVPIVIKANTSVKGFVTSNGWSGYLVAGHELVAPRDAPIVTKLRDAGAVILGHTNMPDFAASDTTNSSALGRTGNAYDWRYSPGGSSGGTVTSVAGNMAVLGNGTDTANSIRMPAGTSALVGVLPTRGLVSIAGIHPLDWLRDNTGPIARTVTDAAIALDVMAGEDPLDFRTHDSAARAEPRPYVQYLKADALKGRRFGVPAFVMLEPSPSGQRPRALPLTPEARAMFMKAIDELRAAGATVVIDDSLLPVGFLERIGAVKTNTYRRDGLEAFLRDFGPEQYRSIDAFEKLVRPIPPYVSGSGPLAASQRVLSSDPDAQKNFWGPQSEAYAEYETALDRNRLDGLVYPSAQMPPNDETAPGPPSTGPHSETGWNNAIGVPAVVVPAGFYPNGLPFGLEISARRWKDGDLLGWAFAFEQATKHRRPPVLIAK